METTVAIAGGIGFFLLGMAVMTDGLKALAGSALRTVLAKAAATSLSGTVLGRGHHAPGAVVQRHDHDHHRPGKRRAADISARPQPGVRREHRHHRDGMAGGAAGRQGLAHGLCAADRLRRRAAEADGQGQMGGERRRDCGFRADPGGPDDAAAGHGRPRRTAQPG